MFTNIYLQVEQPKQQQNNKLPTIDIKLNPESKGGGKDSGRYVNEMVVSSTQLNIEWMQWVLNDFSVCWLVSEMETMAIQSTI